MLYDNAILTTWPCPENRQWFNGVMPGEPPSTDRSVWIDGNQDLVNDFYGHRFHPFAESDRFQDIVNCSERVVVASVFEESGFPAMASGRVALLGDAAHSMTSFIGQGGCQAIEDATELINTLHPCFTGPASSHAISHALEHVYRPKREGRTRDLVAFSRKAAGLHMARLPYGLDPPLRKLIYKYMPDAGWIWLFGWLYEYQPVVHALQSCDSK